MSQPINVRGARCPKCRRWLYLVLLRPDGQPAKASELPLLGMDECELERFVYRSEEVGSCQLWVKNHPSVREKIGEWEEITLSGLGGPDGSGAGRIECKTCGEFEVADLKPHFEKIGF